MNKIFFHIDVNSAYLSWTSVENLKTGNGPDLRDTPSIIGGDSSTRHGIVLAKSIPAKKYGIETAEPIVSALKKCPSLVIAAPDHRMYSRYSHALMEHLSAFCPDIEQVSVDECYMDYTPVSSKYPSPTAAATALKDSVRETFGYTVNVGISDRKVLAKMASDFQKPDLVHTLYSNEIADKMWPLPVSRLFLCGRSSAETLRKLGILTIGELAATAPSIVTAHLKSHGQTLWNYANGIDDSDIVTQEADAKGIGNSTTLAHDVTDRSEARRILLSLSESVASRLRSAKKRASCLTVEIKYASFTSVSHQTMLDCPADSADLLYRTACLLFDELWTKKPVRLLGIRATKLSDPDEPVQMSLFDLAVSPEPEKQNTSGTKWRVQPDHSPRPEKYQKLDQALDQIRGRYGKDSVVRGTFFKPKKP